jgi:hypothetical protein
LFSLESCAGVLLNGMKFWIETGRGYAEARDPCSLLDAIQNDSRLGFSLASFVRQAIWMDEWIRPYKSAAVQKK